METLAIAAKDGETKMLQRDLVDRFRDSLGGGLVTPGNDGRIRAHSRWLVHQADSSGRMRGETLGC